MNHSFSVLIGTYTRESESNGIYHIGDTAELSLVVECDNPSYLALDPNERTLFCVNECGDFDSVLGGNSGAVSAFRFNKETTRAELLSQQTSLGADPCHLSISAEGSYLIVSNYSGGSLATLDVTDEGQLIKPDKAINHEGSGPHRDRQECAHVHSSLLDEENGVLYVADLGADLLVQYRVSEAGKVASEKRIIKSEPGAGPRFMAKANEKLYLLNELDNTLACYNLPDLTLAQIISVVPDQITENLASHIVFSEDKRFLYISNRGFDTLEVFSVEPEMKLIQTIPTGGKHPRHFTLLNNDEFLLVANQFTDNLVMFSRHAKTGLLSTTDLSMSAPSPTFLLPLSQTKTAV